MDRAIVLVVVHDIRAGFGTMPRSWVWPRGLSACLMCESQLKTFCKGPIAEEMPAPLDVRCPGIRRGCKLAERQVPLTKSILQVVNRARSRLPIKRLAAVSRLGALMLLHGFLFLQDPASAGAELLRRPQTPVGAQIALTAGNRAALPEGGWRAL